MENYELVRSIVSWRFFKGIALLYIVLIDRIVLYFCV